jgi:hypothetical protein
LDLEQRSVLKLVGNRTGCKANKVAMADDESGTCQQHGPTTEDRIGEAGRSASKTCGAVGSQLPLEFQIGYVKKVSAEYTGERHVVTVGRAADSKYQWEERRGAPANEDCPGSIIRLFLVRA